MVVLQPESILSGPTKHPRWGQVLTIDLGKPDSTLAISRDNRLPRAAVVITLAAQELMRLSKGGEKVQRIVVLGSEVDPTEHPGFKEISENLRDLRNKWFPRAKLSLLSVTPKLDTMEARIGASIYDFPIITLEHGTTKTFAKMTGRKSTELSELTRQLASMDRVVIRACFVRGDQDNSTENEVRGWIKRLKDVSPSEVQVFSPDPRTKNGTQRGITKTRMQEIFDELSDKLSATVTLLDPADAVA